jgi:AAA family ATPase
MSSKKKSKAQKSKTEAKQILTIKTVELDKNEFNFSETEPRTGSRPQPLRVYINTKTMEMMKLSAGDFLLLGNGQYKTLGYAWPTLVVSENCIQLSKITILNLQCSDSTTVKIDIFEEKPVDIPYLIVSSDVGRDIDSDFLIYLKEVLIDLEYCMNMQKFECFHQGKELIFTIHVAEPFKGKICRIRRYTQIRIQSKFIKTFKGFCCERIGGLDPQIKEIQEMVDLALNYPYKFTEYGLIPPKGLICHGPPGTGKTLIAKAIAAETNAHVIIINGPEIISKIYGETEQKLKLIFQEAIENQPCIIFLDEIDALCPNRDQSQSELEKRIVTCILTLMDGTNTISDNARIFIMAATNRINSIDTALRRPGRFDREFEIGIPNSAARYEILQKLCADLNHDLSEEDIQEYASRAHGYVGADLAAICREAGINAIERVQKIMKKDSLDDQISNNPLISIQKEDFEFGLSRVRPSVIRQILLEVPKVYWEDIGGQVSIKQRLKEAVEWPLRVRQI